MAVKLSNFHTVSCGGLEVNDWHFVWKSATCYKSGFEFIFRAVWWFGKPQWLWNINNFKKMKRFKVGNTDSLYLYLVNRIRLLKTPILCELWAMMVVLQSFHEFYDKIIKILWLSSFLSGMLCNFKKQMVHTYIVKHEWIQIKQPWNKMKMLLKAPYCCMICKSIHFWKLDSD